MTEKKEYYHIIRGIKLKISLLIFSIHCVEANQLSGQLKVYLQKSLQSLRQRVCCLVTKTQLTGKSSNINLINLLLK